MCACVCSVHVPASGGLRCGAGLQVGSVADEIAAIDRLNDTMGVSPGPMPRRIACSGLAHSAFLGAAGAPSFTPTQRLADVIRFFLGDLDVCSCCAPSRRVGGLDRRKARPRLLN